MEIGNFGKRVILTGAGFSKPFGGRLAADVWSDLICHTSVQANARLRELLLANQNYEEVIAAVASEPFCETDYLQLEQAVLQSFSKMDYAISAATFGDGYGVNVYKFQEFLNFFSGPDAGYIFTLNQDLLLERHFYNHKRPVQRPGVPAPQGQKGTNECWFEPFRIRLSEDQIVQMWKEQATEPKATLLGHINYIKLHGSMDWRGFNRQMMIMGSGKASQIENSPLLAWYQDIFRTVVNSGQVRILAQGYSFKDEHINSILSTACTDAGAQIYIWNPALEQIKATLASTPEGRTIWSSLIGFCSDSLEVVFPGNQTDSPQYESMRSTFFRIP